MPGLGDEYFDQLLAEKEDASEDVPIQYVDQNKVVPAEIRKLFKLGNWYRRLPRTDNCKAPNKGSKRPPDIQFV